MTNETKHTPKPFRTGYLGKHVFDANDSVIASCYTKEDASHIVKCVNMHDELVEALKKANQEWCELYYERYSESPNETPYAETLKKAGAI